MRKIAVLFSLLALSSCAGVTHNTESQAFLFKPFTSLADAVWAEEAYTVAAAYGDDGVLTLSFDGGELECPVTFSLGNDGQTVTQGEITFYQPLDEVLPSSAAAEFYTAAAALAALGESEADENGDFYFYGPTFSAVTSKDGTWKELNLRDGTFKFRSFTFTWADESR